MSGPYGSGILAARELTVHRGGRVVLADISLSVSPGELLALVGPNGAGKSTLLAALAGEVTPVTGQVTVDGRPLAAWRPVDLARRRALLPQQSTLAFNFGVRDVVAMGRAPWRRTPHSRDDEAAIDDSMNLVGIMALADRSYQALSGGEQARVALARVLAQRTPILLLDEPTAALDVRHQELVMRLAARRASDGGAVVVVLHDLGLAAAYATRVALLHTGRVVGQGTPERVLTAPALTAVYEHPIRTSTDPASGALLILPR
jgi:iron complex transport system ATP-binding protein